MKKIKARRLKGFRDFLPDELNFRRKILTKIEDMFISNGFSGIQTPALEYFDILMNKYAEEEKLVYNFKDFGNRHIALRYDLTVPTARVLAQHQNEIKLPFKRYQIQPVWRADNTQKGRFREFYQCDIDIFGAKSYVADAELLNIAIEVFENLGFENFIIRINNRKILNAISKFIKREDKFNDIVSAIDKWDKRSIKETKNDLLNRGLTQEEIEKLLLCIDTTDKKSQDKLDSLKELLKKIPQGLEGVKEIENIFSLIKNKKFIKYDPTIARGLAYYTGVIFEIEILDGNVGSVAGGGRYDNLIGSFINRDIPATGISFGIERIFEILKDRNYKFNKQEVEKIMLVNFKETINDIFKLAEKLRKEGKRVFIYPEAKKISKQLEYADKNGFKKVYILGPDEIKSNRPKIKLL